MTTPRVTVPVEPLWMMHVIGPDDIYPAPDHVTAVEWCAYLNREIAPKVPSVLCVAVPAIWTGTPEEHAEGLPESIKGWAVPASPASEGGAVDEVTEADAPAHLSAEGAYGWACGYNAARAAVATREEAPAEAGERDVIAREVWIGFTGNQNAWDRAKDTDNETAKYCWATADRILALRAQPQARPTASDIAKFADANMTPEAKIKSDIGQPPAREDALRAKGEELVKALKRYGFPVSGAATVNLGAFGSSEAMAVDFTTREFTKALAALQAEQKGGA